MARTEHWTPEQRAAHAAYMRAKRAGAAGPLSSDDRAAHQRLGMISGSEPKASKRSGLPRGVYRAGTRYRARIRVDGKERHLGCYDTIAEAEAAYRAAQEAIAAGLVAEHGPAVVSPNAAIRAQSLPAPYSRSPIDDTTRAAVRALKGRTTSREAARRLGIAESSVRRLWKEG